MPLLFALYLNDPLSALQSPTSLHPLFLNETKLYRQVRHGSDVQLLQMDLNRAVSCSDKWRVPFNEAKYSLFHIKGPMLSKHTPCRAQCWSRCQQNMTGVSQSTLN